MPNDIDDIYSRLKGFIFMRLLTQGVPDPGARIEYSPDQTSIESVSMSTGVRIKVNVVKAEEENGVVTCTAWFIVSYDGFAEPLIDPVDACGKSELACAEMAADAFCSSVMKPLLQSLIKESPVYIPVDYLGRHYDFDMYARDVLRMRFGGSINQEPTRLVDFLKDAIPEYLGSKKYY